MNDFLPDYEGTGPQTTPNLIHRRIECVCGNLISDVELSMNDWKLECETTDLNSLYDFEERYGLVGECDECRKIIITVKCEECGKEMRTYKTTEANWYGWQDRQTSLGLDNFIGNTRFDMCEACFQAEFDDYWNEYPDSHEDYDYANQVD